MDASQVIKLKLKQLGSYTHPYKAVDSSTYTQQKQLKTQHFYPNTTTCPDIEYNPVTILPCFHCGQRATTTISTDSSKQVFNHMAHQNGSGTRIYSSEALLLQKASRAVCSQASVEPSAIVIPPCHCESNSESQPNVNPFQPVFDVQYSMKYPSCTVCYKGFETNDLERCQCRTTGTVPAML
jgi:hypothetical protein